MQLTWNAADNAQVYFVVYSKSSDLAAGNYVNVQMRPFNGTEGTIDGLDGGVPYSFNVTGMRWNWINYGAVWGNFTVWQHATPSGVAALPTITLSALENGAWLEQNKPALANQVKALPWVADGVADSERGAAEDLIAAAIWFPNVFSSLIQMSWLGDGVTDAEAIAIRYIRATAFFDTQSPGTDLAGQMLQKTWAQDAITADEAEIIRHLLFIVLYDTDSPPPSQVIAEVNAAASRILAMPFLDTVTSADALAVRSLDRIENIGKTDFLQVMSRPTLNDGITDAEAEIVLLLGGTYQYADRALVDTLLDPTRIIVEKRRISLPRSGEMDLAIIRTAPGQARSMDLLEHSVRSIEEFMGAPFPTNYIAAFFEKATAGRTSAGTYFGTHIAMLPRYDVDDGSRDANFLPSLTAHEVAHYYWHRSEDWIDEGGATFMEFAVEKARVGRGLIADRYPCGYVSSISQLVTLDPSGSPEVSCNYSLGERIFLDLYRNLGEATFRQGFSRLYQMRQVLNENLSSTYLNINHLRNAFQPLAPTATAIINRWYDGPTPRGIAPPDSGPVDFSLPAINGRIEEAFVGFYQDGQQGIGSPVTRFSAAGVGDRWVFVYLTFTFPRTAAPKVQALEYVQYYEDGFAFGELERIHTFSPSGTGAWTGISVGPPPGRKWATGRYWVYVYDGDRKVAEVTYEVTP